MTPEAEDERWQRRCRHVYALLREARIEVREDRLNLFRWIVADPGISSTNDLSLIELNLVVDMLTQWQREGHLESMARQHATPVATR